MRISNDAGTAPAGGTGKRDRARREATRGTPSAGDAVTISAEARRRVESIDRGPAAMGPEERSRLVAALKAEVDSGDYRPDLRRTAMLLIRDGEDTLA